MEKEIKPITPKEVREKIKERYTLPKHVIEYVNEQILLSFDILNCEAFVKHNDFVTHFGKVYAEDIVDDWCNPFSWCDKPELEVATKRFFRDNPRMDLSKYPEWLEKHINLWQRKQFSDFDYIKNELTKGQSIVLLIIILILDIFISIFFIGNEVTNEGMYDNSFIYDFKHYQFKVVDNTSSFFEDIWDGIAAWWIYTLIPILTKIENSYKNIHTWK